MMPKDRLRQLTGEERLGQERESEYLGAEDIDDGKSVQMGEFGIFSPTIRAKSADDEKEVSSKSIVQRKILFYPGKIFKTTLDDMSITRRAELDTDYTDGSSNNGSGSVKPNPGGDGGKGDEEAPDPTV